LDTGLKVRTMTLPDVFQDQDKPDLMYDEAGLTARHIAARAIEALGRGDAAAIERLARA
jgi:1-deoxy-D-xylulose-5-phosphate synthase